MCGGDLAISVEKGGGHILRASSSEDAVKVVDLGAKCVLATD